MRPALKISEVMPKLQQFVNEHIGSAELKDVWECDPCIHECYDYLTYTKFNEAWYGVDILCKDLFTSHWRDEYFQVDETSIKGLNEGRVAVTLWVSVRIEDDEQF